MSTSTTTSPATISPAEFRRAFRSLLLELERVDAVRIVRAVLEYGARNVAEQRARARGGSGGD